MDGVAGEIVKDLLHMLHQSGLIEVESAPEADLRLRRSPLIDF